MMVADVIVLLSCGSQRLCGSFFVRRDISQRICVPLMKLLD
jgi:hypothetical protein